MVATICPSFSGRLLELKPNPFRTHLQAPVQKHLPHCSFVRSFRLLFSSAEKWEELGRNLGGTWEEHSSCADGLFYVFKCKFVRRTRMQEKTYSPHLSQLSQISIPTERHLGKYTSRKFKYIYNSFFTVYVAPLHPNN